MITETLKLFEEYSLKLYFYEKFFFLNKSSLFGIDKNIHSIEHKTLYYGD